MKINKNNVGKGYRLLRDNEIPVVGDEVKCKDFNGEWTSLKPEYATSVTKDFTVKVLQEHFYWESPLYYRRKISTKKNMKNQKKKVNKSNKKTNISISIKSSKEFVANLAENIKKTVRNELVQQQKVAGIVKNECVKPAYIIGNDFISVSFKGTPTTIYSNDARFERVKQIIKDEKWDQLEVALSTAKAIAKFTAGKVEVFDGVVTYNGNEVKNPVVTRILEFMNQGFNYKPLVNFLDNLMLNPNADSRNQLYTFLERYKMPITDDGMVIAMKAIKNNHTDKWTGKIDNSVGANPKMPREKVSQSSDCYCGPGLHHGWYSFVTGYGGGDDIAILTEFNPKDVCRIPKDASYQKIVVCEYKVIKDLGSVKDLRDFNSNYAPATEQGKDVYTKTNSNDVSVIPDEGFDVSDYDNELIEENDSIDIIPDEDYIKSLKGQKTDTEIRKEIRKVYNVKKTQGNAIFNRLFGKSNNKVVKAKKQVKEKKFISADKAYSLVKSGKKVYNSNMGNLLHVCGLDRSMLPRSYYRDYSRNKGWYILD